MSRCKVLHLFVWLVGLGLTAPVTGQSLAEAAAREKERRKGKTAGRVITEHELSRARFTSSRSGRGSFSTPEASGTTGSVSSEGTRSEDEPANGEDEQSPDEARAERRAEWRKRLEQAQTEVQKKSVEVNTLQTQANSNRGLAYSTQRTTLLQNLEKAKAELATARKTLEDLQEKGRRSGFR